MRISDWSSDVCSSDLRARAGAPGRRRCQGALPMTASLPRLLLTAAVSAGLLFGLAACGKKGAPKPPAGEESQYQYPHHYPAPETVVPNGSAPSEDAADPLSIFDSEKRSRTTTY